MMPALAVAVHLLFPATAADPPAYPNPDLLVEVADLKPGRLHLLDVRGKANYEAGHVPGAVHLEWSDLIDPKTGKFLPPEELKNLAADRKIDPGKPAITYCQSGGRAAVAAFGLELLGARNVRNYYRSWSEWGNAEDTPVATPPKK
jgi:3-mercaptopyruvate sulfurtransferase SseA